VIVLSCNAGLGFVNQTVSGCVITPRHFVAGVVNKSLPHLAAFSNGGVSRSTTVCHTAAHQKPLEDNDDAERRLAVGFRLLQLIRSRL
jgi:hypothetical protein